MLNWPPHLLSIQSVELCGRHPWAMAKAQVPTSSQSFPSWTCQWSQADVRISAHTPAPRSPQTGPETGLSKAVTNMRSCHPGSGGFLVGNTRAATENIGPFSPEKPHLPTTPSPRHLAVKPLVMQPHSVERPVGKGCVGGAGAARHGTHWGSNCVIPGHPSGSPRTPGWEGPA